MVLLLYTVAHLFNDAPVACWSSRIVRNNGYFNGQCVKDLILLHVLFDTDTTRHLQYFTW